MLARPHRGCAGSWPSCGRPHPVPSPDLFSQTVGRSRAPRLPGRRSAGRVLPELYPESLPVREVQGLRSFEDRKECQCSGGIPLSALKPSDQGELTVDVLLTLHDVALDLFEASAYQFAVHGSLHTRQNGCVAQQGTPNFVSGRPDVILDTGRVATAASASPSSEATLDVRYTSPALQSLRNRPVDQETVTCEKASTRRGDAVSCPPARDLSP